MAQTRIIQQSFNGGEVTPEFFSRIEDVKRQNGAATMLNMIATPQGPATNRPGTKFVRECFDSENNVRLIPFVYSVDQSFVIELGEGYARFHTAGGTLMHPAASAWSALASYAAGDFVTRSGGTYQALVANTNDDPITPAGVWYLQPSTGEYQIHTDYDGDHLFDIHYTQSNDVLTLVHPSRPPKELRRHSATYWSISDIAFSPSVSAPTGVVHDSNRTVGSGSEVYFYKVTAVGQEQADESLPSSVSKTPTYSISAITKANPGMVTLTTAHEMVVGQPVTIAGVLGMTEINGSYFIRTVNGFGVPNDSFTLEDANGTAIDTTSFGTYTSAGTAVGDGWANDLLTTGNKNAISWSSVSGAVRYNVYKLENGLYGYIGQTDQTSFTDENIAADTSKTAPESNDPFDGVGDYPRAVTYFEQRRVFAGTTSLPQNIWMTRTGTESNLGYSIPSRDDDAIKIRVASRDNHTVRHLVPMSDILALTNSGEWRITSVNGDAITPSTISVRPQSYVGASNVVPLVVNNVVVYAEARGGHVRELAFSQQAGGYMTNDLSIRSPHLFDGKTIADAAYARSPFPVCWFASSDGWMLGLTYVPEQQVWAWHRHETVNGVIESVCAIPEGGSDALYMIVRRNINDTDVRYVERMADRFSLADDIEDAFFVDCGATYSGAPATTISGLDHLEGQEVAILADGAVHPAQTVTGGEITLEDEASVVHVGLPITADLETLPAVINTEAYGQSRAKNVSRVWPRVYRSSGIYVGPNADNLKEIKQRTNEPAGTPPTLRSEELEILIPPSWGQDGRILIRHTDPLPMTVVSITMEVSVGG